MMENAAIETGAERRAMRRLIGATLVCAAGLIAGLLWPQWQALGTLDQQLDAVDERLRTASAQGGDRKLMHDLVVARNEQRQLVQDLEDLRARFNTFSAGPSIVTPRSHEGEGRIDFKVALLEAQKHLKRGTDAAAMELPADLGMDETIGTSERVDSRLWQLMTVVKLIEQVRDAGIRKMIAIKPLAPLSYPQEEGDLLITREFPVEITMACSYAEFVNWLHTVGKPGSASTLRRFRAENRSDRPGALLQVTAVCGAGLIRERRAAGESPVTESVNRPAPPELETESLILPPSPEDPSSTPRSGRNARSEPSS